MFGKKWLSGSGDTEQTLSDAQTELQTDKVVPIYPPTPLSIYMGVSKIIIIRPSFSKASTSVPFASED